MCLSFVVLSCQFFICRKYSMIFQFLQLESQLTEHSVRIRSSHHRFFYQRNQSGGTIPRSETLKKNWRHFLSCRQFLICSTIFDYNCSDACASIFLFVLILVHLFLLIDLFLSHFTNLLFFSSEGRYLRSMTPRTPLQLHFH